MQKDSGADRSLLNEEACRALLWGLVFPMVGPNAQIFLHTPLTKGVLQEKVQPFPTDFETLYSLPEPPLSSTGLL